MNKVSFTTNMFLPWIKGEVEVDNRFIKTSLPNVLFGFLPAGKDQQNIPLKNVSSAMISSKFIPKTIVFGLAVMFVGLVALFEDFFAGLLFMAIGVAIAGNGIITTLHIEKSGRPYIISVPFYEKSKLQTLNTQIHDALAADTDKTDLNMFFDKKNPSEFV